jgi:hypothetical protein
VLEALRRQRAGLQFPVKGQAQNSRIKGEILLPGLSAECHLLLFAYSSETSPLLIEGREKRAKED